MRIGALSGALALMWLAVATPALATGPAVSVRNDRNLTLVVAGTDAAETITVRYQQSGSHTFWVIDAGAGEPPEPEPSSGCSKGEGATVYCQAGLSEAIELTGGGGADRLVLEAGADTPEPRLSEVLVDGGAGDDAIVGAPWTQQPFNPQLVRGGDGNDDVRGGPGDDRLEGGRGADALDGGPGQDALDLVSPGPPEADRARGGTGNDTLQQAREGGSGRARITLDDLPNDGLPGEGSDIGSDIETIVLSVPTDFTGSAGANTVTGSPGADTLQGSAGDDKLSGGAGGDTVNGGAGADTLNGDAGEDTIDGGAGGDGVYGGAGPDSLTGGPDSDTVRGDFPAPDPQTGYYTPPGSGDDTIDVRDGTRDRADCGLGDDRIVADTADLLGACEVINGTRQAEPCTANCSAEAVDPPVQITLTTKQRGRPTRRYRLTVSSARLSAHSTITVRMRFGSPRRALALLVLPPAQRKALGIPRIASRFSPDAIATSKIQATKGKSKLTSLSIAIGKRLRARMLKAKRKVRIDLRVVALARKGARHLDDFTVSVEFS